MMLILISNMDCVPKLENTKKQPEHINDRVDNSMDLEILDVDLHGYEDS